MSVEETRRFLDRLWALQAEARLSNAALARILGCDPSYVGHLKAGRKGKRIGLNVALAAVKRFPALAPFLQSDFPVSNTPLPLSNDAEQEGQP